MRPGRATAAVALGLAVAALGGVGASVLARGTDPFVIPIGVRYSTFLATRVTVPVGRPVTFVLSNGDPIDHEWIVGDAAGHERHRTGTEPVHGDRPTEISLPAGTERTTVVTFTSPGTMTFICHLPGHEAYGMIGTVEVVAG